MAVITRRFGIHQHTVHSGFGAGLPVGDGKQPMLVFGA